MRLIIRVRTLILPLCPPASGVACPANEPGVWLPGGKGHPGWTAPASGPLASADDLAGRFADSKLLNALETVIRHEISVSGAIPFTRFMELALYHPEHGYYEGAGRLIGRRGDYFTSVSVGSLFGDLLAFQFAEWLEEELKLQSPESEPGGSARRFQLVEAGAHNGRLAADILAWLRRHRPELLARIEYWIVEPSPRRRDWQKETLTGFAGKVRWLSALPTAGAAPHFQSIRGVIFANELLDALPVHRLGWDARARRWFEWGVGVQQDRLVWQQLAAISGAVQREPLASLPGCARLEDLPPELLAVLPDGFTVEVCPRAVEWWRTAARALERGWLVTVDYGLTAEEFFRPERTGGTARAYCQHRSSVDLLDRPGEQDLTAHVNFAALQAVGEAAGLRTQGIFAQGQFLAHSLRQAAESGPSLGDWTPERTRQLQTLLHPDHLGRAFRVLVQTRPVSR